MEVGVGRYLPADGRVRMAWMVEREKVKWAPCGARGS